MSDSFLDRACSLNWGRNAKDTYWNAQVKLLREALGDILRMEESDKKDGAAFIQGRLKDGETRRQQPNVCVIELVGIDIESGEEPEPIADRARELGLYVDIYPTFNDNKGETRIATDKVMKFAKLGKHDEASAEQVLQCAQAFKGWLPNVTSSAKFVRRDGHDYIVSHIPTRRFRVIVPFSKPLRVADLAPTFAGAKDRWALMYREVCDLLHVQDHDDTCENLDRLFYKHRRPHGAPDRAIRVHGQGVDPYELKAFSIQLEEHATKNRGGDTHRRRHEYRNAWLLSELKKCNGKFRAADFVEASGVDHTYGHNGAVHTTCPNPHDSGVNGPADIIAVNSEDATNVGGVFVFKCNFHNTCNDESGWALLDMFVDAHAITREQFLEFVDKTDVREIEAAIAAVTKESTATQLEDVLRLVAARPAGLEEEEYLNRLKAQGPISKRELRKTLDRFRRNAAAVANESNVIPEDQDPRPPIFFTRTDNDAAIEEAWRALDVYNAGEPRTFHAPGGLARVDEDDKGQVIIRAFDGVPQFANEMKRVARWYAPPEGWEPTADEPFPRNMTPPQVIIGDMLEEKAENLRARKIPPLKSVITTPRVAKDGSIDVAPGYKPVLAMIYRPPVGFVVPPVADVPSVADVRKSIDLLLANALEGFVFKDVSDPVQHPDDVAHLCDTARRMLYGTASRANALAALLTPFAELLYSGPTPLFALNKTQPRTGATKLADIISRITLGHAMRAQALPQDDEEWRKQITTWVDIGLSMLFIDNIPVAHILSSGALASALTAEWWQDRMLGTNRLVTGPIGWRWFITGNNLMLSSELADRAVMIRMAAGVAHPELRSDFKHHDLTAWIDEHRPELVWACLTLVRNWVVKGCPKDTSLKFGGFDDWARVMDGVLREAGVTGFLANRKEITRGVVNTERTQLQRLMEMWLEAQPPVVSEAAGERFVTKGEKCASILRWLEMHEILLEGVDLERPRSAQTVLGMRLAGYRGQVMEVQQRRRGTGLGAGLSQVHETRTVAVELEETWDKHAKSNVWRLVGKPTTAWVHEAD